MDFKGFWYFGHHFSFCHQNLRLSIIKYKKHNDFFFGGGVKSSISYEGSREFGISHIIIAKAV